MFEFSSLITQLLSLLISLKIWILTLKLEIPTRNKKFHKKR